MPAYANSTNISATYAVLFVGIVAVILRSRQPIYLKAVLAVDAAILAVGILLTQARSAWLASLVGVAILALTGSRRTRVAGIAMLLAKLSFAGAAAQANQQTAVEIPINKVHFVFIAI
jgi:O-antigen ligase